MSKKEKPKVEFIPPTSVDGKPWKQWKQEQEEKQKK